ncbi:WD40_repeat protein [Hexamita inflata]|uniref:WD40_repeat protein n=1 Tax=Hexamita inflata TaxID=28002 RepID=A0ABP1LNV1_9EUKA
MDPIFNFSSFTPAISNCSLAAFSGQTNKFALYFDKSNSIQLFELSSQKPLATLNDFTQRPTSLFISKNEQLLAVGFDSGTIRVYDLTSFKALRAFTAHRTAVTSICIQPSCCFMATGSLDGSVKFWDLENHQVLQELPTQAFINNKPLTEVSDPQVCELQFNQANTWLFIGDKSGRVLTWSLQKMQYGSEFMLQKEIKTIHAHILTKNLFVSIQNATYVIDLQSMQIIKQLNRQYHKFFTPLKNMVVVGIRSSGMDIMDLQAEDMIQKSYEANFKNTICCGERKTSTIPQILVLQTQNEGQVSIEVCSLKVMDYFRQFTGQPLPPKQTEQSDKTPYSNQQQAVEPREQPASNKFNAVQNRAVLPRSAPKQPEPPKYQNPVSYQPNGVLSNFMLKHQVRMKILQDKMMMLRQIQPNDPVASAIEIGDLPLFISVYSNFALSKVTLQLATKIVLFLNNQIQLIQNISMDQLQFIHTTVIKLANSFRQVVSEAEFVMKNNRRDINAEDRFEKTQDFKQQVIQFTGSIKFLFQSGDQRFGIKLQTMISELGKLGW